MFIVEKYDFFLFLTVYSLFSKTASISTRIYIECCTHPNSDLEDWSVVKDVGNGEFRFGLKHVGIEEK